MKRMVELHNLLDEFMVAYSFGEDARVRIYFGKRPIDVITDRFFISDEDVRTVMSVTKLL